MASTLAYPKECVNELINFAVKHIDALDGIYYHPRGRINTEKDRLQLVLNGHVRIEIRESGQTLGVFFHRIILGAVEQDYMLDEIYYVSSKDCHVLSINAQKFYTLLSQHYKMNNMITVISYFVAKLLEYYHSMLAHNAYTIVKKLIERYVIYQQLQPTGKESLVAFILSRSVLSRSIIMKILADLRRGEYIKNTADGGLELLKKLPRDY